MGRKVVDLTNRVFGNLTVIKRGPNYRERYITWICKCSCGKETIVESSHLNCHGDKGTKSCGCKRITHGASNSPEYLIWLGIIARCTNPNDTQYKYYGGRGIQICREWRYDFEAFFKCVGYRQDSIYSIERINNNGNYEPGNVRWATRKEQMRNTRYNHVLEFNGIKACIQEWSERTGIKYSTIKTRIERGWTIEEALSNPSGPYRRKIDIIDLD